MNEQNGTEDKHLSVKLASYHMYMFIDSDHFFDWISFYSGNKIVKISESFCFLSSPLLLLLWRDSYVET